MSHTTFRDVTGRKRHIIVDTLVHRANIHDTKVGVAITNERLKNIYQSKNFQVILAIVALQSPLKKN